MKKILVILILVIPGVVLAGPTPGVDISPFGAQTVWPVNSDLEIILNRMQEAGIQWGRFDLCWWGLAERVAGVYDFTSPDYPGYEGWNTDRAIDMMRERGIEPFPILCYGNELYDNNQGPFSDTGRTAFGNYCYAAVDRYKDKVTYWEIWNEPNTDLFWGRPPDPEDYAKLCIVAAARIREANPDAVVIGGATASIDQGFLNTAFSHGLLDAVDVITVHPYRINKPESINSEINSVRAMIAANTSKDIPVWTGEWGYNTYWTEVTPLGQAKCLARMMMNNLSTGIGLSIWFSTHPFNEISGGTDPEWALVDYSYNPRPSHTAFSVINEHFAAPISYAGDPFNISLSSTVSDARIETFWHTDTKEYIVALWRERWPIYDSYTGITRTVTINITEGSLIAAYDGLSGAEVPLNMVWAGDQVQLTSFTITDYPIYLKIVESLDSAFQADITRDCAPFTSCFTVDAVGAISWEWDFDEDGFMDSDVQTPCYTYTIPGVYDVSLTVSNGSIEDTLTKEDYITVLYPEDICVLGTNLMGTSIYNSDFEGGMDADTPAGWTASGQDHGDKTTAFSLESAEPYAGLTSALVETSGTPADPNDLSIASLTCDTPFALVKDHTYLVTAMVRRSQSQWTRMILHSAGFSLIHTESYDALDDGIEDSGWQKLSLHFTAPININEAYFRIDSLAVNSRTAGGGTVRMWVDEVSVIDLGIESYTDIYNETTPPQYGIRNRYFDLATETEVRTVGGTVYSCTDMPRRWDIAFAVDTGSNNAAGYPLWGQETPSGLSGTSGAAGYVRAMAADTSKPAWPAIYADGVNYDGTANDGRRHVLSFDYGAAGTTRPLLRVFMIEDDFDHYASLFVDPVVGVPGNRMWPLVMQTTPTFGKGLLITRFDNVTLGSAGSGVHTDETTVYIDNVIMNSVD